MITIKPLDWADLEQAQQFAIEGMNLRRYVQNRWLLNLYSCYFVWSEALNATHALGAYQNETLVGAVMVAMKRQPRCFRSWWRKLFVVLLSWLLEAFFDEKDAYNDTNTKLLRHYQHLHTTDGELNFFAVDPAIKGKGIGSKLLNALAELLAGKHIYLYTDSGCTYQFYQQRGFALVGQQDIQLDIGTDGVPLSCMLFAKTL